MSEDIVDRLRFDAARCEIGLSKGVATNIDEAADEIERLRAECGRLREVVIAARKSLPSDWPSLNKPWSHCAAILDEDIARAALKENSDGEA